MTVWSAGRVNTLPVHVSHNMITTTLGEIGEKFVYQQKIGLYQQAKLS